ncbi:MAG: damage-control phosphatase ARMT1 family protein [Candidatus Dormibacteraceae bacterium]
MMPNRPLLADLQPITGADPSSFANRVITERHPTIIRQILADRPSSPAQVNRLNELLRETVEGRIRPLPGDAHDAAYWLGSGRPYFGERWTEVPFLWAESFFYRWLLDCLEFFEPGPWHWVDPFQPMKEVELKGKEVELFLEEIKQLDQLLDHEAFARLLRSAVLGNRADLGFRMMGSAEAGEATGKFEVVDDHTESIWEHLCRTAGARIVVLADNAALEILGDLILCDFLIHRCGCSSISLQLKPTPYYVSDATTSDVLQALRRLRNGGSHAEAIGARLMAAFRRGSISLETHDFYCRPEYYYSVPSDLLSTLANADLVISKGDLNYRRLVGDVECDPTIRFENACAYFPSSLAALRSLKSDVALGLTSATVAKLEATGSNWRTEGTHGVIQCRKTVL